MRSDLSSGELGKAIEDSVVRHMRSDVPMCCLLSGGVDSSIIATIASDHASGALNTYCAGAREDGTADSPDFAPARLMAGTLNTNHTEVPISGSLFLERWKDLIARTGSVISTPNEIAIYEVAIAMRHDGHVVTLSGEGADELFGGYTQPLTLAQRFIESGGENPGAFQLDTFAWLARTSHPSLLKPDWIPKFKFGASVVAVDHSTPDEYPLLQAYREIWDRCVAPDRADEPLLPHMRFQREVNLAGLLRRLDSMTMLASIEGRTPFADARIAELADGLPTDRRFQAGSLGKLLLRDAFADRLPEQIAQRPKAGFPLPFENWIGPAGAWLSESRFAQEIFAEPAMRIVAADPSTNWQHAWPMLNVALWADHWF